MQILSITYTTCSYKALSLCDYTMYLQGRFSPCAVYRYLADADFYALRNTNNKEEPLYTFKVHL